jgi:hypothetical protein
MGSLFRGDACSHTLFFGPWARKSRRQGRRAGELIPSDLLVKNSNTLLELLLSKRGHHVDLIEHLQH